MAKKYIPLSSPFIFGNEWKYVKDCLDTEWVSSVGKYVSLFEKRIAKYTGAKYAVASINGTSALHVSLILMGVGNNDEVIVPTITFIAPINAVRYCNAHPIFMDSDNNFSIDVSKTIEFIENNTIFKRGCTYNLKSNRKIKAIIVSHLFGRSVFLDELVRICKKRNIKIVEDAAESLGNFYNIGKFKGRHTGTVGDIGCLSFNGNKVITSGGGGMIITNSKKLYVKAMYLTTQAKDNSELFVHDNVGFNYRLSNVQAAIGLAQLENINKIINKKKKIYNLYKDNIKNKIKLNFNELNDVSKSNYWLNLVTINNVSESRLKIELLIQKFKQNDIEIRPIWKPNHLQKPYLRSQRFKINNATNLIKSTICLPSDPKLTKNDVERIVSLLSE